MGADHPGLRAAIKLAATVTPFENLVVAAAGEARRLAAKFPECGMSEQEIRQSIVGKATARKAQEDALARLSYMQQNFTELTKEKAA